MGGDAINKFVGVLDAERRTHDQLPTTGYFDSRKRRFSKKKTLAVSALS
jgi:hypothetical protein